MIVYAGTSMSTPLCSTHLTLPGARDWAKPSKSGRRVTITHRHCRSPLSAPRHGLFLEPYGRFPDL